MGERKGAKHQYFRFEDLAVALPPAQKYLKDKESTNLRLYCIWLSSKIVILANGCIKTSQQVQQSPNCISKFSVC